MQFSTIALNGLRRPLLPMTVLSDSGRRLIVDALVDSGSDITLLPARIASELGIDLSTAEEAPLSTGLGIMGKYRRCDVQLELRWNGEVHRWRASVGFFPAPMRYSLLGTKGFFEFFDFQYRAANHAFELQPSIT